MTLNSVESDAGASNGHATDHANEIWERMLAAGKEAATAYVDACQKAASSLGEFRDKLGMMSPSSWDNPMPAWPGLPDPDVGDALTKARERTLEVGEKLREMSRKATLGYLKGCEQAVLAVTECDEQIAATSNVELVKVMGGARVDFAREVTKAYVSAARELVG